MIPTSISADDFLKQFCALCKVTQKGFPDEPGGSIWDVEGRILSGLAARLGGPILEIGSLFGVSTRYLAEGVNQCEGGLMDWGAVLAVDPHHQWDAKDWPAIIQYSCRSVDLWSAVPDLRPQAKWAFIDGDHSYEAVLTDIDVAKQCGCERMVFHDTRADGANLNGARVRPAVLDRLGADPSWRLYDVDTPCGMIYADHGS